MDRIEITDIDEKRRGINVDFEDGDTLVNLTFREKDLDMLKKLLPNLEEELKAMKVTLTMLRRIRKATPRP